MVGKSRSLICDEVITFNRGEACVTTACLCPRSQENRFSFRTTKLLLIPINFLPGKLFVDDFVFVNSWLSY